MRCFYTDTFVLPLPEGHRFPMAKYSGLRERLLSDRIVSAHELARGAAGCWEDLQPGPHARNTRSRSPTGRYPRGRSGGSAFPGPDRWSSVPADRSARRLPQPARRCEDGWGPTSPAAPITRLPIAVRGTASSTTWQSPPASSSATGVDRVAVVDCDVHQGNGTAAIFAGDQRVFTLSLHGAKNYPFRKDAATSTSSWTMAPAMSRIWRKLAHSWMWCSMHDRRSSSIWQAPIPTKAIDSAG